MGAFGACCKRIIEQGGVKYRAVAEATHYDVSYVSKWVNSDVLPAASAASEICGAIAELVAERSEHDDVARRALSQKLRDELNEAYALDSRARRASGGKAAWKGTRGMDRREFIFAGLRQLCGEGADCELTICGDLANMELSELVFLVDILDYACNLDFRAGEIRLMLPEGGLDDLDDGACAIALINMFMVRSRLKLTCCRALVSHPGLMVYCGAFLYNAQCWAHGRWLIEELVDDGDKIERLARAFKRDVAPTAQRLFSETPIDPVCGGDTLASTFWRAPDRMLMGVASCSLCSDDLLARVALYAGAGVAERCSVMKTQLTDALEAGRTVRCIFYSQALDNLVYSGWLFVGTSFVELSLTERFRYLQNLATLLERYPNLEVKVLESYIVKDITHAQLPIMYLDERGVTFVPFSTEHPTFCRFCDYGAKKAFERCYELLWNSEGVSLYDIEEVMYEYFDKCEAMTP